MTQSTLFFGGLGQSRAGIPVCHSAGKLEAVEIGAHRDIWRAIAPALGEARKRPPRPIIAHSAGALSALAFASRVGADHLTLIDPTHPLQFDASAKQQENLIWARHQLGLDSLRALSRNVLHSDRESQGPHASDWRYALDTWRETLAIRDWCRAVRDLSPGCSTVVFLSENAVRGDPVYADLWLTDERVSSVSTVTRSDHFSILRSPAFEQVLSSIDYREVD